MSSPLGDLWGLGFSTLSEKVVPCCFSFSTLLGLLPHNLCPDIRRFSSSFPVQPWAGDLRLLPAGGERVWSQCCHLSPIRISLHYCFLTSSFPFVSEKERALLLVQTKHYVLGYLPIGLESLFSFFTFSLLFTKVHRYAHSLKKKYVKENKTFPLFLLLPVSIIIISPAFFALANISDW